MTFVWLVPLRGQSGPIEVIDGRPLAKVVRELESRHEWQITYEDPIYEDPNQLEDVTALARRGTVPPGAPRLLVPRNRLFRFEYNNVATARPQEVLQALLKRYNSDSFVDAFRVIQQGSFYHVVPETSLNAKSTPVERRSRLDVQVTVDDRERTAYEMLRAVLKEVSAVIGSEIGLGLVPMNVLQSQTVRGGARNENARDVLVRTLAATKVRMSWQLFCDPGALKLCAFNIHQVATPK